MKIYFIVNSMILVFCHKLVFFLYNFGQTLILLTPFVVGGSISTVKQPKIFPFGSIHIPV
jgi:hypothetical protein